MRDTAAIASLDALWRDWAAPERCDLVAPLLDKLASWRHAAFSYVWARGEQLRFEAVRIDTVLHTYSAHTGQPRRDRALAPIEHHDMMENESCGCATCSEWALRRMDFVRALRLLPKEHKWSTCACDDCRFIGRAHLNYLAATNRRDVLIEMAFYARLHSRHSAQVMTWLEQEMQQPEYTVNWCAQEMSRYPMGWWLRRCQAAIGPVISGSVFHLEGPGRLQ